MVSKQKNEVEETADHTTENGATSGPLHVALLRSITAAALFDPFHTVLFAPGVRLRGTDARRRRLAAAAAGFAHQAHSMKLSEFQKSGLNRGVNYIYKRKILQKYNVCA